MYFTRFVLYFFSFLYNARVYFSLSFLMNTSIIGTSYDIRGIYPSDIDEDMAYRFGQALVRIFAFQCTAVGYDARLSGPALRDALIRGITDAGSSVVDIGLCSTDMCGFATARYADIDFSIMITASHNPKEYNGFKMTEKNAKPVNTKTYGAQMREMLQLEALSVHKKGSTKSRDIVSDWVTHILSFVDTSVLKDLKVVVDAGSGTAGVFMAELAKRAGFTMIPLFLEPDGNFPYHHPSPIEPENTLDMRNKVREVGANLGVAFDGDADRMYVCDESGEMFSGTITTAIIASIFLPRHPGEKFIYNAVCGDIVPETIVSQGGASVIEKVGHVYIKETMAKDPEICAGGEHSGHYYFRDNNNADSGVIAFIIVLEAICLS